jgi:hypothetical protein
VIYGQIVYNIGPRAQQSFLTSTGFTVDAGSLTGKPYLITHDTQNGRLSTAGAKVIKLFWRNYANVGIVPCDCIWG